jgi:hypothetical protein
MSVCLSLCAEKSWTYLGFSTASVYFLISLTIDIFLSLVFVFLRKCIVAYKSTVIQPHDKMTYDCALGTNEDGMKARIHRTWTPLFRLGVVVVVVLWFWYPAPCRAEWWTSESMFLVRSFITIFPALTYFLLPKNLPINFTFFFTSLEICLSY